VKSIAALMGYKDERRVQQLIAELYAITLTNTESGIARWFFGLPPVLSPR
jgi:hypothetical protein